VFVGWAKQERLERKREAEAQALAAERAKMNAKVGSVTCYLFCFLSSEFRCYRHLNRVFPLIFSAPPVMFAAL
jgi:hypothetical protein